MSDETESIRIRLQFEADQAEKAANRMERQLLSLEGRYDPLARATKKLDRDQKLLAAAFDAGKIDAQRHATMMENVQREYAETETRARSLAGAIDVDTAAVSRLNAVLGSNQTRMFSMQMSQMVQQTMAGGDALRSIAMQLPDIGLAFGTAGIAIGAVGGLLIPVISNKFGAGDAAEDAGEGVSQFRDALADYQSHAEIAGASTEDLRARFGQFAEDVRDQAKYMADLKASTAVNDLTGSDFMGDLDGVNRAIAAMDEQAEVIARVKVAYDQGLESAERFFNAKESLGLFEDAASKAASALGMTVDQARQLAPALNAIGGPDNDFADVATTARAALEQIQAMYAGVAVIPPEVVKIQESVQGVLFAAAEAAATAEEIGDGFNSADRSAQELLATLNAEIEKQATIAAYGRDSAEVAALRAQEERAAFEATLASSDAAETMKDQLRLAFVMSQDLTQSNRETATAAAAAASSAGGLSGNIAQASAFAAQLLGNLGQVPAAIGAIAGRVDAALGALQSQNSSLTYQLEQGLTASAAAIKTQRDDAIALAAANGASIDQLAEMGQSFDAQAAKAEELANANTGITKTLADNAAAAAKAASAIGGGSGGGGGGRGGLSGATRAATEAAREQEEAVKAVTRILADYDRQAEKTAQTNRDLAIDTAAGLLGAASAGDLRGGFAEMGRSAQSAFFDAWKSGGGIGDIFSKGMSGITSGLSGGMAGIGSALSSAMPIIGGITTAIGLLKGFSSKSLIGQGVSGQIGGGATSANEYSTTKKTSWWGLRSSTSTDSNRNDELSRMLGQAATATRDQVRALADSIGGTAQRLGKVALKFDIDTKGMDAEGVQQALTQEIAAYQERVAEAALGTRQFSEMGEAATATLARLTGNLSTYNDVQRLLGMDTLPKSIANAAKAGRILEGAGGAGALSAGASSYLSNVLDEAEQERLLRGQMRQGLRRIGYNNLTIANEDEFQRRYETLLKNGQLARAAELLSMAPLFTELNNMTEARAAEAQAVKEQAAALRAAIADERKGIQRQIWDLTGNEAALRSDVLKGLDASNRALQQQYFALVDQTKAAEAYNVAVEATMDLFRTPLTLDSARFDNRFEATINAAEDRRAQIRKQADDVQLTELRLINMAITKLANETRDRNLREGV